MPSWSRFEGREDIIGVRDTPEGREFLMHNEALCNPYYTAMEAKMDNNELTPEALERLEKIVAAMLSPNRGFDTFHDWHSEITAEALDALLRAYRKLDSELSRISSDFELWWEGTFGSPKNSDQEMTKSVAYHAWSAGRSQSEAAHTKEVMLHAVTKFELEKAESELRIAKQQSNWMLMVDEVCIEYGPPEYKMTDDGEAYYWNFPGHDLPVADNLSELLVAGQDLITRAFGLTEARAKENADGK